MDMYRPRWTWMEHLIIGSCASPSDSLISLSHSMPAFIVNSFGLFSIQTPKSCKLASEAKPLDLVLLDLTFDIFSKFNLPFPLVLVLELLF